MPVIICSSTNLKEKLPDGLREVDITSLNNTTNLSMKYIQAKIHTKYILNTSYKTNSIKFILESCTGKLINFHAFGPISTDLSACSFGDILVLTGFEVDICPKDKRTNGPYQIILDDQRRERDNTIVWVVKASHHIGSTSNPLASPSSSSSASSPATNKKVVKPSQNDGCSSNPLSSPLPSSSSSSSTSALSHGHATNNNRKIIPKNISYSYTLIKDVKAGTISHIYGVVSYVRSAVKTRATDYYMLISIVDPSVPNVDDGLKCNLFHIERDKIPTEASVGDIIRFHRIKIQTYQDKFQGRNGPGFHWVLFQGSYEQRIASSTNYSLEAVDKNKVCELLKWWKEVVPSCESDTTATNRCSSPTHSTTTKVSDLSPSSSIQLTPMKVPPVVYQTLEELREDTTANLYAVVIYCRPPVRTVNGEYYLMLNISDHSLNCRDEKITCNLFDSNLNKLPHQAQRGDVIRIHDLKIRLYKGKKQGGKDFNFRWVLFKQSFNTRIASCSDYVVEEEEKAKVQSLLDWWQEGDANTPFSKVVNRQYFDIVCQVISSLHFEQNNYRLLKVWDGTKFDGQSLKLSVAGDDGDETLAKVAGELDLIHDVFLFDNHVQSSQNIKPRDYIRLTNLHAAVVSGKVEMTLHGGTSYMRSVKKLNADDQAVIKLKSILDPLVQNYFNLSSRKDGGSASGSKCAAGSGPAYRPDSVSKKDSISDDSSPSESVRRDDGMDSSTCRKRLFDKSPEAASKRKKMSNMDSDPTDKNPVMDSIDSMYASGLGPLSVSSIPSPPSSLELTEIDKYYVEAILAREEKKAEDMNCSKFEKDRNDSCVSKECRDTHLSGISGISTEGIELSITSSSIDDTREVVRRSKRLQEDSESNNDKEESNPNWKRNITHRKADAESRKDRINERNEVVNEIVSSQESYHTAFDPASPISTQSIHFTSHQSPTTSQRRYLSLRTEFENEDSAHACSNNDSSSKFLNRDKNGTKFKESEDIVSSSMDSRCSIPNDRQHCELDNEEISSSTDRKDSTGNDVRNVLLAGGKGTVVSASTRNNSRKYLSLHNFITNKKTTKFKVLVRASSYSPCTGNVSDLVQFCCLICKYMVCSSDIKFKKLAKCPNGCGLLKVFTLLRIELWDGEYEISASVFGDYAIEFFQGVTPHDLLHKSSAKKKVQRCLDAICPPETDLLNKPLMECCVFSYISNNMLQFQVFDTVVI